MTFSYRPARRTRMVLGVLGVIVPKDSMRSSAARRRGTDPEISARGVWRRGIVLVTALLGVLGGSELAAVEECGVGRFVDDSWGLALDGGRALAGGRVFELVDGDWINVQELVTSDGVGFVSPTSEGAIASLDGDRALARGSEGIYVFERSGGGWVETHKLTPTDADSADGWRLGGPLDLDGDRALITAYKFDGNDVVEAVRVRVFERAGDTWVGMPALVAFAVDGAFQAPSVSLDGDRALIGAHGAAPGGSEPPAPFAECGADPTEDGLGCELTGCP